MVVFTLTMSGVGSWNGKWNGAGNLYCRVREDGIVPKELWNRDFFYRWPDGWEAEISVERCDAKTARKIEKGSMGFCGYDWMIDSLIKYGEIVIKE